MDTLDGMNNSIIDEIFEEALERIAIGEPTDAVINSYSEDHQPELNSLLSFADGLEEIALEPLPLPSTSRRVSAKQDFLAAAALERGQHFAEAQKELVVSSPSTKSRPTRKLVEPDEPTFWERLGSIFSTPTARLAPIGLALLILFGGGWYVASDSYPGTWAYPIKQTARGIGLALVPESARPNILIAQGEAKQKEIERARQMAVEEDMDVQWDDTAVVVAIEESDDGDSISINTTLGSIVVAGEAAIEKVRSQMTEGSLGQGSEIRSEFVMSAESLEELHAVEVEVIATPDPKLIEAAAAAAVPSTESAPAAVLKSTCTRAIPSDWQPYTVAADDTLTQLASLSGVGYLELARINCIDDPNIIPVGSAVYLPPVAFSAPAIAIPPTDIPTVTTAPTVLNQMPADAPTVGTTVVPSQIDTPEAVGPTPTDMASTVTLTVTYEPTESPTAETTVSATIEPATVISTPTAILSVVLTVITTAETDSEGTDSTESDAAEEITTTVPITPTLLATPSDSSSGNVEEASEADDATATPVPTVVVEDGSTITNTLPVTTTVEGGGDSSVNEATPTTAPITTTATVTAPIPTPELEGAALDPTPMAAPTETGGAETAVGEPETITQPITVTLEPTAIVATEPDVGNTEGGSGDSSNIEEGAEPSEPTEPQPPGQESADEQAGGESGTDNTQESNTPPPTPIIATATLTPVVTIVDTRTSVLIEPPAGQSTGAVVPAESSPVVIPEVTVSQPPDESTTTDETATGETDADDTNNDTPILPAPSRIPEAPTVASLITPQVVVTFIETDQTEAGPLQAEPVDPPTTETQSEIPEAAPTATTVPIYTNTPMIVVPPTLPPTAVPVQPTPTWIGPAQPNSPITAP